MADESPNPQTLAPSVSDAPASVEATIELTTQDAAGSSYNNYNVETSTIAPPDGEKEKSLEYADELMEKGSKASKEHDYAEATDCFSRALEIRVAHYGELAPECVYSYYKYGCALLYKAQEEADPLGSMPKKDTNPEKESAKNGVNGEASSDAKEGNSDLQGVSEDGGAGEDREGDEEGSDGEETEADEDESDLDLAWKMLDVARAIAEKQTNDTIEKVDILSALAEVALEREDVETSLGDYLKALSMLERLVEPDNRYIAELNFRICLCLEIGSKAQEAIPYCEKAISVCKSRLQRLTNEVKGVSDSTTSPHLEKELSAQLSSNMSQTVDSIADKEKEIETLTGLASELEKKLEDLQQIVSNPSSILSDILGMVAAKAAGGGESGSSLIGSGSGSGFEPCTVSTVHTNGGGSGGGVTHLGVVGRGIKRASTAAAAAAEASPAKKPATDPSAEKDGSNDAAA